MSCIQLLAKHQVMTFIEPIRIFTMQYLTNQHNQKPFCYHISLTLTFILFAVLQVQEFLSCSKSVDKKETSSQCSIGDRSKLLPPAVQSIAVNTGKSLLWPTVDMTTTHSDTNIRGYQQAEGISSKTKEAKRDVCHHCNCHSK